MICNRSYVGRRNSYSWRSSLQQPRGSTWRGEALPCSPQLRASSRARTAEPMRQSPRMIKDDDCPEQLDCGSSPQEPTVSPHPLAGGPRLVQGHREPFNWQRPDRRDSFGAVSANRPPRPSARRYATRPVRCGGESTRPRHRNLVTAHRWEKCCNGWNRWAWVQDWRIR